MVKNKGQRAIEKRERAKRRAGAGRGGGKRSCEFSKRHCALFPRVHMTPTCLSHRNKNRTRAVLAGKATRRRASRSRFTEKENRANRESFKERVPSRA